jgi:hypothetical protein
MNSSTLASSKFNFYLLNLIFFAVGLTTLLNTVFYGLGYFISLAIFFYGIFISSFKIDFKLIPILIFIFLLTSLLLLFHNYQDFNLFLRLFMISIAIFIAKSIRQSFNLEPEILANFFVIVGLLTAFLGLKQFFLGYSDFEYYFLSFNDSMQEENIDQNIKRGLGIYFDPLTQGTFVGIAIHSAIYLRDNFKFKKLIIYLLIPFFFTAILITLSRASIVGLLFSFLIYFNRSKFKYIISILIVSIIFLILGIFILILTSNDLSNIQNLIDSTLSIGQVINLDVDVGSRFNSTGSYGSRMDGIKSVLNSLFDSDALLKVSKNNSARDLGFFSIPVLYGVIIFIFIFLFLFYLFFKILLKSFFAKGFSHYSLAITFFILCQSLVTFQLDSFANIFILSFFLTFKQNSYVTLVFK